ncbi:MAG: phosphopantetheine-binding protein [Planctomycetota bacterium]
MIDATRTTLAGLVAPLASPAVDPGSLEDGTRLLEGGLGLDSVALLELVVLLEQQLGVVVASEDIGNEHFETFGTLMALVARHRE